MPATSSGMEVGDSASRGAIVNLRGEIRHRAEMSHWTAEMGSRHWRAWTELHRAAAGDRRIARSWASARYARPDRHVDRHGAMGGQPRLARPAARRQHLSESAGPAGACRQRLACGSARRVHLRRASECAEHGGRQASGEASAPGSCSTASCTRVTASVRERSAIARWLITSPCRCGSVGCLETLASTRAVVQRARELAPHAPESRPARPVSRDGHDLRRSGRRFRGGG